MKIAVLGSKGYIGQNFTKFLNNKNIKNIALSRKECDFLNKESLYKILKKYNPDYIINSAGFTGKPNVDACELNKEDCWKKNYTVSKNISEICQSLDKKWIQISSGCIYSGTKSKNGFKETDKPNFCFDHTPCSYYSGVKSAAEDMLKSDKSVYICRLRIPFNHVESDKNYITKLLRYNTLLSATNSLSQTDEFIEGCFYLIQNNCDTGIYNITNTGSITTKEVIKYINKYVTDKKFTFFKNEEEFYSIAAKTPRSNCILDNSKLRKTGYKISNVEDAIIKSLKNYNK
jgi:UDP-glucose 4,6-dehydratase